MSEMTMVNFRMDSDLKKSMEKACKDMGLSMTTAFTMFATKVNAGFPLKSLPTRFTALPTWHSWNV